VIISTLGAATLSPDQDSFARRLEFIFEKAIWESMSIYRDLRVLTYALSYVGEAEAIARATGEKTGYILPSDEILELERIDSPFGGSVVDRVRLYWDRMRRSVLDAFQMSLVKNEDAKERPTRVLKAFPLGRELSRPQRVLRSQAVREADTPPQKDLAVGHVDEETWRKLIDEVVEELPTRGGEEKIRFKSPLGRKKTITRYEWELEQEFTYDFVTLVRAGQVDAANENGYTDMVWVSIIDDKTDVCCTWRDGKTTSEIEAALAASHKDDECQAVVPPAHPKCRCDLAPATKKVAEFKAPPLGDFAEWLTT
jgi:hypothetical protein